MELSFSGDGNIAGDCFDFFCAGHLVLLDHDATDVRRRAISQELSKRNCGNRLVCHICDS